MKGKIAHLNIKIHGHTPQRVWSSSETRALPESLTKCMTLSKSLQAQTQFFICEMRGQAWVLALSSCGTACHCPEDSEFCWDYTAGEKWGWSLGHEFSVLPPLHLLALGSWDLPYVTRSGKGGQEGKNITPTLSPSQYRSGFWGQKNEDEGDSEGNGKEQSTCKIEIDSSGPGHSSVLGAPCGCQVCNQKRGHGGGLEGRCIRHIVQSV